MWRDARLAFTDSLAALSCSIVPAHPWIHGLGQQTENGAYLSPVNAVRYLAERLAGSGGHADVVIMMVMVRRRKISYPGLTAWWTCSRTGIHSGKAAGTVRSGTGHYKNADTCKNRDGFTCGHAVVCSNQQGGIIRSGHQPGAGGGQCRV